MIQSPSPTLIAYEGDPEPEPNPDRVRARTTIKSCGSNSCLWVQDLPWVPWRIVVKYFDVDPTVWNLVSALIGGSLALSANLTSSLLHTRHERLTRLIDRNLQLANDRKAAYLQLLSVAREVRNIARKGHVRDLLLLDALRSDLSNATYQVELLGDPPIAEAARVVSMSVREYLSQAISADHSNDDSLSEKVEEHRRKARRAVDEFIELARKDLATMSAGS